MSIKSPGFVFTKTLKRTGRDEKMPSSFLLLVSVTLILNVSVLIVNLGLYLSAKSKHELTDYTCTILCLPVSGGNICDCSPKVLNSYLEEKYIKSKLQLDRDGFGTEVPHRMDTTMQTKPTANMKGNSDQSLMETTSRGGMTSLLSWRIGNDCHLSNGMRYRNGRLVVPVDGIYFVYGQLDISLDRPNNNSGAFFKIDMTKSNILRGEKTLFSHFVPYAVFLTKTSASRDVHFSSAVKLKAQDELYIRVSNNKQLRNPSSNMIGVYML